MRLLGFQAHRFLGLTRVVERIIEKWKPLEECLAPSTREPGRARPGRAPPIPFPLAGKLEVLTQLLSLLLPVTALNKLSQAEYSTQVQTLISLYHSRMNVLDRREPLPDHRSTEANEILIPVFALTPIVAKTRIMLADVLDKHFFKRYTDVRVRSETSYVFEAQLFLQPQFKNLE